MVEQELKELNEELVEWLQLDIHTITDEFIGFWVCRKYRMINLFTQSLDSCFELLIPNVYEKYGQAKTRALLEVWAIYISSGAYWGKEALALCYAIKKLVKE